MQIISTRKKKSNNNRLIIANMLILVILIIAVLLGSYSFIAFQNIYDRARMSLEEFQIDTQFFINDHTGNLFYVFECRSNPTAAEEDEYMDETEIHLVHYYKQNRESLHFGEIYHYYDSERDILFMPEPALRAEENNWRNEIIPEGEPVLAYCEVSYFTHNLQRNILAIIGIAAVVIILLFLVSRYSIRLLDKKDTGMKNFFANASHELKTPLMSIRGNVDGIRNGYVDTEKGCDEIEKGVDRMSNLISSILEISRVDSGAIKPDLHDNDVREIIYDVLSSLLPEMERRGVHPDIRLADPIVCQCDDEMFYSAFSNIMSNAVRYAETYIGIRSEKNKNGQTNIYFENDGTPISEEDRKHIFDRFYTGSGGQSGLGMALAQEYMKMHNRTIQVDVRNGHTVFWVEI